MSDRSPIGADAGGTGIPGVLLEQRRYYAARADEYDDAYRRTGLYDRGSDDNASWHADLNRLVTAFDAVPINGDVVELAAGSGFWSERLVERARSLTLIDASAEMLLANRHRLGARAMHVKYEVADLFDWRPPHVWDACVFGFWLCHVPDERVAHFLNTVAASLRDDGVICFVDKATTSEDSSERAERRLNDGRQFTIIDHPRSPDELVSLFAAAGMSIEVETIGSRFCLGWGRRA